MMRHVNADRQQTTMANWCIIVVEAVIMVYESSVVVVIKKKPELGPVPGHETWDFVILSLTRASDALG